jgi:LPS sulfotransferase NodH
LPWHEREWSKRWGTSTFQEYLDKGIEVSTTPNGVFGVKIHWDQFEGLIANLRQLHADYVHTSDADLLSAAFPGIHYVWITRADKVRQSVSYLKALQTNLWWTIDGIPQSGTQAPEYDFDRLAALAERLSREEANWQTYFVRHGIVPLHITYEAFTGALELTVTRVIEHLGLTPPGGLVVAKPRLKKQADMSTEEWVEQYYRQRHLLGLESPSETGSGA